MFMQRSRRRAVLLACGGAAALSAAVVPTVTSVASSPPAASTLQVSVFASGSSTMTQPDDITTMGGNVYAAWQNGVGSMGQPAPGGGTTSDVVEYSNAGASLARWALTGKVDGFGADLSTGQLIATVNEDGNSSLYTIDPNASAGRQVTHYVYNLDPLPHGGGSDAVTVYHGQILISASAPTQPDGPALYRVTLSGGIATVQPVFFDNSPAERANTQLPGFGTKVPLALTDPDSSEVVPASSARFAGDLVLDSQGDQEQVYVGAPAGNVPQLSVLRLSQAVDDSAWITSSHGTLYATDGTDNEIFAIRGTFTPGTVYTSVTPADANTPVNAPSYLGVLDLNTGMITPAITTIQAKGLVYVP